MRSVVRLLVAPALIGLVFTGVALGAASQASAATPKVTIVDNDGPTLSQGIDPRTAEWGFAPMTITVMKGEAVTFVSPANNARPHVVVSISRAGTAAEPVLESGTKFNSGTAMEAWVRPGGTWALDTTNVEAGYWAYYCSLHPWMVGTITVLNP